MTRIRLLGGDGELGRVVAGALAAAGHELTESAPEVVVDVTFARQNTLINDGLDWGSLPRFAPGHVAALSEAARGARLVVAVSFAFGGADPAEFTDPGLRSATAADRALRDSGLPLCLLRLGFIWGEQMKAMRQYRAAFTIFRPYYAGPPGVRQSMLEIEHAAAAVVAAVAGGRPGEVRAVADQPAISFAEFMDAWARRWHRKPVHLPRWVLPFLGGQIAKPQRELLDRSTVLS